jgi:Zn-dependent M28 family amino/carboxypeptidase
MATVSLILVLFLAALLYIAQPVWVRSKPAAVTVDEQRLRATLLEIVAFSPRDVSHPENLDRLADHLAGKFRESGGRISKQYYRIARTRYQNVIATFGPEEGERVIIGAHYDVAGEYPGADDNASGVAVLVELAQMLGKQRPAKRVDLVAFTLEEPPIFRSEQMGSWVHAQSVKDEGAQVRGMISVEMVGYFSDEPGSQQYPAPALRAVYGDRADFISVVGRVNDVALLHTVKGAMASISGVPVHSINGPRSIPGIDFSDHASYWDHGFPALMVTDTSFYRNPHYHTATDTPETLDYHRMGIVAQQLYAAIVALTR